MIQTAHLWVRDVEENREIIAAAKRRAANTSFDLSTIPPLDGQSVSEWLRSAIDLIEVHHDGDIELEIVGLDPSIVRSAVDDLARIDEGAADVCFIRRVEATMEVNLDTRDTILKAGRAACYSCCRIFGSAEIREWANLGSEGLPQTAICPFCEIDAVIAWREGIDEPFLRELRNQKLGL